MVSHLIFNKIQNPPVTREALPGSCCPPHSPLCSGHTGLLAVPQIHLHIPTEFLPGICTAYSLLPSGVCSNVTLCKRSSLTLLSKISVTPSLPLSGTNRFCLLFVCQGTVDLWSRFVLSSMVASNYSVSI